MYIQIEICLCRCGHCKRLAPEYEKAATTLAADDPPIPLAKVDCPANNALCSEYGVTGYPTLKIFRGGEYSSDYQGPRSAGKIKIGGRRFLCFACMNENVNSIIICKLKSVIVAWDFEVMTIGNVYCRFYLCVYIVVVKTVHLSVLLPTSL